MTIRIRLTAWYAGIMFVSLLTMGVLTYRAFAPEPGEPAHKQADEADEGDLREMLRILFWCGVPPALLALGGGWWLMRRSLAPVAALSQAAGRVTEHNLREVLPRTGNGDELDRLTEIFNAMTARLDGSFQRIREFTLHASHELKTPLTVLHGELEAALGDPALPPAHRERCATQLEEVDRLTKIVDALTLLTKADAGQITLAREPVRLDELLRDAFDDAQILAQPRLIQVTLDACDPATITGDRNRLRQLLLNLVDNAVKYNHPGGTVKLSLRAGPERAELSVANTGPGIPSEQQARVFDRFYRGDPSHNNDADGCGLGLSIAQWIVTRRSMLETAGMICSPG